MSFDAKSARDEVQALWYNPGTMRKVIATLAGAVVGFLAGGLLLAVIAQIATDLGRAGIALLTGLLAGGTVLGAGLGFRVGAA